MNRNREEVEWDERRSRHWHPRTEYDYASHVHWFCEDVRLFVMPYTRDEQGRETFRVTTIPAGDELPISLSLLLNVAEHWGRPAEDVEDFIRNVSWILAYEGRAIHEIILGRVVSEEPRPQLIKLELLPFGHVSRVGGTYVQWLPRGERPLWRSIPSSSIWELRLPRKLGTPTAQRRLIRNLARLSSLTPEFALRDPQRATSLGYDFSAHRLEQEASIARVTDRWAWPARSSWRQDSTEYFQIWREIRFRRSMTLLREHIVTELNRLLGRLGVAITIGLEQPVSVERTNEALRNLSAGTWDFARATREAGVL
jgi:hypothetical protein